MRKKITPALLAAIPALLDLGMGAAEIAFTIGCTVGTLRVRCSQMGISLRRRQVPDDGAKEGARSTPASAGDTPAAAPRRKFQSVTLELPRGTMDRLQERAAAKGISDSQFVSMLLEVIARDDLYAAVLDGSENAGTLAPTDKLLD
jgi:hypothetical protein